MKRLWLWLPLAMFALFVGTAAWKLYRPGDTNHGSKLVGKPMPAFVLAAAVSERPGFSSADLRSGPRLINIFASWCVPCASEAGVLAQLASQGVVIDGIAIRDRPEDLNRFLARNGNPYRAIGADLNSQVQIALGSSGVPETFLVDSSGIIRHQHIGEITPDDMADLQRRIRLMQ